MVHSESALLVEDDIPYAGIPCAHRQFVFASMPGLGEKVLDNLPAEPLPLTMRRDSQLDYLTRLTLPSHGNRADHLSGLLHPIDSVAEVIQAPAQCAL